jgi:hypothetical protein
VPPMLVLWSVSASARWMPTMLGEFSFKTVAVCQPKTTRTAATGVA